MDSLSNLNSHFKPVCNLRLRALLNFPTLFSTEPQVSRHLRLTTSNSLFPFATPENVLSDGELRAFFLCPACPVSQLIQFS